MSGSRKIEKDHYLFREGDAPDAMFVVKSGKFAVVKTKANSEIILAEIGPGAMVGEMAFFDNKPRSASVKALKESEVIALPYKSLHAQFSTFPEWCKAIMRTVNDHLRNANQRLKQLEKTTADDPELFPPHTMTKMISIINFVGNRYGKVESDGLHISGNQLRNHTIQIFQEPTHKMQKLTTALEEMKFLKVEELGEGKQKIIVLKPELLFQFVEWYNEWLFTEEKDRSPAIKEEELKTINGLLHFARKLPKGDKGLVKINLTEMQNDSMKELGYLVKMEDFNSLVEKKIMHEKMTTENTITSTIQFDELDKIAPFWGIIYTLQKIKR